MKVGVLNYNPTLWILFIDSTLKNFTCARSTFWKLIFIITIPLLNLWDWKQWTSMTMKLIAGALHSAMLVHLYQKRQSCPHNLQKLRFQPSGKKLMWCREFSIKQNLSNNLCVSPSPMFMVISSGCPSSLQVNTYTTYSLITIWLQGTKFDVLFSNSDSISCIPWQQHLSFSV